MVRPNRIHRSHLIQAVLENPFAKLVLVSAPAGYGKSTFLAELIQALKCQDCAVAWFSIDSDDDQCNVFGAYLIQCITEAIGHHPQLSQFGQVVRAAPVVELSAWMPVLINAIAACGQEVLLVLDDYHTIQDQRIQTAISFLANHMPANMRLAIGTRTQPHIPLARFRAQGNIVEINQADLRFNLEETGLFLKSMMKLDLKPEAIQLFAERTEGWVAGLQLAALSMERMKSIHDLFTGFPSGHRYLVNYLIEEVFDNLQEKYRDFLLQTALLERMCAPLCDAVIGEQNESGEIIEELERRNLFIVPVDGEGKWYRYHHLFRDFLLSRKIETSKPGIIHKKASKWLLENGLLREAAKHAFACGDWEYAAAFVEKQCFNAIIHSEITALADWCSRFPEEVINRRPLLAVSQCWGSVLTANKNERDRIIQRLDQAKIIAEELANQRIQNEVHENDIVIRQMMSLAPDPEADPVSALIHVEKIIKHYPVADAGQFSFLLNYGYIHMAMNELGKAKAVLQRAREIAIGENLLFGIVESSFQLARIFHASGKPGTALDYCNTSLQELNGILGKAARELPGVGGLEIAAGFALYELNKIDEAEERLVNGLNLVGWGTNPYYFFTGNFALIQLYKSQGRIKEAAICLKKLESVWPDTSFLTKGLQILLDRDEIKNDRAARSLAMKWCEEITPVIQNFKGMPGMGPFGGCEMYYQASLIWIEIQSELGDRVSARRVINSYLDQAESSGHKDRMIELFMIKMAMMDEGQVGAKDWDRLAELLIEGNEAGYFQKFLISEKSAEVLSHAARRGIQNSFLEELLREAARGKARENLDESPRAVSKPVGSASVISEREKEILILLERGRSNQEIAISLVITIGTVKSHVNHILRKLDASNRTQAVANAREQGLLDG